jgi:molecular chaperone GrpE
MSNCGENCGCNKDEATEVKKCSCKETISTLKKDRDEANDKYVRLYAEFENYKKRSQKDKEDAVEYAKIKALNGVLDLDNDLKYAKSEINKLDESQRSGLNLIFDKLTKFITSQGIQEVQTDVYDVDLHEVVSVLPVGEDRIVEVLSKGYILNGKVIRYPKIILGKK